VAILLTIEQYIPFWLPILLILCTFKHYLMCWSFQTLW